MVVVDGDDDDGGSGRLLVQSQRREVAPMGIWRAPRARPSGRS